MVVVRLRASAGDGLRHLVDHRLLAVADPHRVEAHEATVLGGIGGRLGGSNEPHPERRPLLGRSLGAHDGDDATQLFEDALPRVGTGRLEPLERVLARLRHVLDVERHLAEQLLAAGRVGGVLQRRHRLLGRLDRAAGVGQGDRQPRHEGRAPHPGPLLLGEVGLRRHAWSSPAKLTSRLIGTADSAWLTGQPVLAAWAASSNCAAVIPGTEPSTLSTMPVIPVPGWKVTSAVVSIVVGGVPAWASPWESAIE